MNAKQFQRLNPNFKFNRIFLYNQTKFNSLGNMKKYLFPLNKINSNNKYIIELKEEKNLDFLTQKLISEYKDEYNKKKANTQNINRKMMEMRAKLSKNNNLLKQIDFNMNNNSDIKNDSFELDINPQQNFSPIINKNKRTINIIGRNYEINKPMKSLNKNDSSKIKSYENIKTEIDSLKLPRIKTNINKRSYNISSLNKNMENQKSQKDNNVKDEVSYTRNNIIEEKKDETKKSIQRDIFKNVNYIIDNKKTQLNINDIKRNIYDSKNMDDKEDEENQIFESQLFINTKIPKRSEIDSSKNIENNINEDNSLINEEIMKRKEKEKYIIYEQNKKYIDKNKIYDAMKYGAASIPNLSLDKGFREVKKFEKNVLSMKKTQTEMPVFIKTKQNN